MITIPTIQNYVKNSTAGYKRDFSLEKWAHMNSFVLLKNWYFDSDSWANNFVE